MSSVEFSVEGIDELVKSLKDIQEKYPYYCEKAIKNELKVVRTEIRQSIDKNTKGHGSKPGTLRRKMSIKKVTKSGGTFKGTLKLTAPHAHLVEEGHDLYSHNMKKIGEVDGKKIVATVMAIRSKDSEKIARKILEEVLSGIS